MVSLVDQIAFLYPNVQCSSPLITGDYSVVDNGSGPRITHWNTAKLGPQPTEAQLAAVTPQQIEAARWQRLRAKAVEALSNHEQTNNAVIRAVVLELLAYANQERAKFNQLLQWLGSQTLSLIHI